MCALPASRTGSLPAELTRDMRVSARLLAVTENTIKLTILSYRTLLVQHLPCPSIPDLAAMARLAPSAVSTSLAPSVLWGNEPSNKLFTLLFLCITM
ncbi:hypothetical protein BOTBODRAFT_510293 [Botryobasidium botryosum FD-172 SS1]|uniref:Uncharacterized protein n=1 Tax=Botryobasidium botryosum (strain FD-172 SS1) TaxID=930990 RepID=A0A067MRJ8_BOTB1|nr:hypothetical protein BOTBODRAFT_510293 [Botryobasidium botryosum FD-172 SS1]